MWIYTQENWWHVHNIYVVRIKKSTLVPEVFLEVFFQERERVSCKASRRERKPSGYLGLESHFHTDDRVRIWPSTTDWLIFLQRRKLNIEEREKTLWLPWPRISLSYRRQGQDLTLEHWLVDIFTKTQIKHRGERENPLVTLASNLTFIQTTGSGSDPRALIGWYFYKDAN